MRKGRKKGKWYFFLLAPPPDPWKVLTWGIYPKERLTSCGYLSKVQHPSPSGLLTLNNWPAEVGLYCFSSPSAEIRVWVLNKHWIEQSETNPFWLDSNRSFQRHFPFQYPLPILGARQDQNFLLPSGLTYPETQMLSPSNSSGPPRLPTCPVYHSG